MKVIKKDLLLDLTTSYWPAAIAAGIIGGIGWLIRIVFTNQTKLTKLETEIAEREKARDREREDIKELRDSVKEMSNNLITLLTQK